MIEELQKVFEILNLSYDENRRPTVPGIYGRYPGVE